MPEKKERSTIVEPSRGDPDAEGGTAATSERQPSVAAERVTVNLTPRSVRAMGNLVNWTGYTKTDTINRALQIYEFIQQIMENGGTVHVRQAEGAEPERLTFF
ncbi:hypothetical protein [Actinophytocola sp.]|uniref:hypothetical protein n=1 Tax=Actinophytocola sp. TaxID=1872138 RepID=UPI0038999F7A